MRESQIKVAIRLIKMQLQGGSITQSEYDTKLAELTNILGTDAMCHPELVEGNCVSSTNAQLTPNNHTTHNSQPTTQTSQPKTNNSQLATIDTEKSRLSNLLHTIPSHKSAKHITDQIIALRKKRKEAYTDERHQRPSTDGMHAVSNAIPPPQTTQPPEKPIYRQMENLRINIGRWEKSLAKLMSSDSKAAMPGGSLSGEIAAQIATLTKKINDGKIKYKSLGA